MVIKILGGGCTKCEKLEKLARACAQELDITADFIKVKDIAGISDYDIIATPALVIDEKVVCSGRLARKGEVMTWLQQAV